MQRIVLSYSMVLITTSIKLISVHTDSAIIITIFHVFVILCHWLNDSFVRFYQCVNLFNYITPTYLLTYLFTKIWWTSAVRIELFFQTSLLFVLPVTESVVLDIICVLLFCVLQHLQTSLFCTILIFSFTLLALRLVIILSLLFSFKWFDCLITENQWKEMNQVSKFQQQCILIDQNRQAETYLQRSVSVYVCTSLKLNRWPSLTSAIWVLLWRCWKM